MLFIKHFNLVMVLFCFVLLFISVITDWNEQKHKMWVDRTNGTTSCSLFHSVLTQTFQPLSKLEEERVQEHFLLAMSWRYPPLKNPRKSERKKNLPWIIQLSLCLLPIYPSILSFSARLSELLLSDAFIVAAERRCVCGADVRIL